MKPQVPIWVALTFLMLMLVLFAALIFMFQGRYTLEDRIGTLQGDATQSAETITNLELNTTTQALARADAEATVAAMGSETEAMQGQLDALNTVILAAETDATTAVEVAIEQAAATLDATIHQPPQISIGGIMAGDTVDPNQMVELVVSASDAQGVASISLSVNGEPLLDVAGEAQPLVAHVVEWNSAEEGIFTFEAIATDSDNMTSDLLSVPIEVVDREARLRELVVQIQGELEEIRGVQFTEPITLTLYTQAQLRENFEEIFAEDVTEEDARLGTLELYAFDWVAADYDLYTAQLNLYSDAVSGFYDPDTKELVVVTNDGKLSLTQRLTLVHEINHALQDQLYGIDFSGEEEEGLAFRALVEGDSSLIETLYVTEGYMTEKEVSDLIAEYEDREPLDLSQYPQVLLSSLSFPYTDGREFVTNLYRQGRFERINSAWENPPTTSEQILHFDLFEAAEPAVAVSVPVLTDTLGTGWEFISEDVLGEFFVAEYLEGQLSEANSERAASGWGGDRYVVHWNEEQQQVVLLLTTEWDSADESNEFVSSYTNYATRKYGGDGAVEADGAVCWQAADWTCLYQANTGATVIRGPSRELILEIVALLP